MRRRGDGPPLPIWAPAALLALVGLAYAALWVVSSRTAMATLEAEAARLEAQGYTADWEAARAGGFPFRVEISIDAPRLGGETGEGRWDWTASQIDLHAMPFNPRHWIARFPGVHRVTVPDGRRFAAALSDPSASLRVDGDGRLVRLSVALAGADVTEPIVGATRLTVGDVAAHLMRAEDDPDRYRAFLGVRDPQWPEAPADGAPIALVLDALIDGAAIDVVGAQHASGGVDFWADAVDAWAENGGAVTLTRAAAAWDGGAELALTGQLFPDRDGRWNGALGLDAADPAAAVNRLARLGLVDPRASPAVALGLTVLDAADLEAEVRGGRVLLLGQPVAELPPLY